MVELLPHRMCCATVAVLVVLIIWLSPRTAVAAAAVAAVAAAAVAAALCRPRARLAIGGAQSSLADEYTAWLISREIMAVGCQAGAGRSCRVLLEGWIMKNLEPDSIVPPLGVLRGPLGSLDLLRQTYNGKMDPELADAIIAGIRAAPARALNAASGEAASGEAASGKAESGEAGSGKAESGEAGSGKAESGEAASGYSYREFVLKPTDRIRLMVQLGGAAAMLRAHLRYATLMAGAHHWSVPAAVFDVMYAEGVRNEAFASPLNSKLMGRPGASFFSLFPDTDAPFGSRGDLFRAPPDELQALAGGWEVNPPFLAEIMARAARLAARLAARRDVVFITRRHDPAFSAKSPYGEFEAVAKAGRLLTNIAYASESPFGTELRRPSFETHLLYAGPRSPADAERLLDALAAAWPAVPADLRLKTGLAAVRLAKVYGCK